MHVEASERGQTSPQSAPEPLGSFAHVRKAFAMPEGRDIVAVQDISFDLHRGKLVSLLGPSGCGKTTFLKIVGGLIRATSGQVRINGIEVDQPHDDFGMAFQQPNLMPWRTVLNNVLFPIEIRRGPLRQARTRAKELLELVGIAEFANAYPSQLSGGMQQRASLCRALVHEPKLLLMDEPFGALDELTRMEMQDLLLQIRDRTKATTMLVTHSISEAVYLSDVIVVFSKRPALIADYIEVALPYPRTAEMRYSPTFTEIEHRAGRALGIIR